MKKTFYFLSALFFLGLAVRPAQAQQADIVKRNYLWKNPDTYLPTQAVCMFGLIDEALTEFPPVVGETTERKLALYLMDAMLHETKYDADEALFQFADKRIKKLVADLQHPVKKGMKIYKAYNDGFIARTQSVTIAFDIVRGSSEGRKIVSDKRIREIAAQCDILFLSHNHGDHVDKFVVEQFTQAGKPVIATNNILKDDEKVTHLRGEQRIEQEIALNNGKKLQVAIFPGHQDKLENNLYVITTPEKKTVAQIGDQSNPDDMAWIANLHKEIKRPDALIINCWTSPLKELVDGFNPKLVVCGHENEMGHTINHRESFWLSFQDMKVLNRDYLILGWGEGFLCK